MAESSSAESSLKISELVEDTGVSKELIHHYLRQGLLPRPEARARYSEQQVRLLNLIKRLREEHNLPLEEIRGLFELFSFEPDRLEPLALTDSFSQRLARFARGTDLTPAKTLSVEELTSRTGISTERLAEYVSQRLVSPLSEGGQDRYSDYDARIIALCENGTELGIPFESFRTIASYIRVAWQLEHVEVFSAAWDPGGDVTDALGRLFVHREIIGSFVQNVLQSLIQGHLLHLLGRGPTSDLSLERVVYRPSSSFIKRYEIQERIEQLQEALGQSPDHPDAWLRVGALQLHGGFHREAAFFLEQALERWPDRHDLGTLYGVASLLSGKTDRGQEALQRAAENDGPLAKVGLALSTQILPSDQPDAEPAARAASSLKQVEGALAAVGEGEVDPLVPIYGGWLLTALPPAFRELERGRELLLDSYHRLASSPARASTFPGLHERYLITSAYLLFECLTRTGLPASWGGLSLEELRTRICRLDPGCAFAQHVYLASRDGDGEG